MKRQSVARPILSLIGVFLLILSAGFLGAYPQEAQAACPPGIISYWQLDETSGTSFLDSVGGHTAGCADASVCPGFISGSIGNALIFDGIDDEVNVPSATAFNWGISDSFSIEFWTKTDSSNFCIGNQVIIGRNDNNTKLHWWVGCWDSTGVAAFHLRDKNGKSEILFGGTALNDGKWHHVAAVRNGITGENSIFVDGRLEGSKVVAYNTGFDSTASLNIGYIDAITSYHYAGAIDELALHNQALTETEIQKHYLDGLVNLGYCADIPPAAPLIISPAVTTAYIGWPYAYNVDATGNPAPTFSLTVAPAGMSIDVGSGIIQWTPAALDEGGNPVTVAADNGAGTDEQNFTIEVLDPSFCPADVTHYWKFDETVAGSYADLRWANSATCSDCPAAVAGIVGGAQQFDTVSRVNVKDDNTFDWLVNDSFSIELWMQTESASTCAGSQVFVGRDDRSTSLNWWLGCNQDSGHARFFLRDRGGIGAGVSSTTDLTDGSWHHVVGTRDAASGTINVYVDGVLEGTQSAAAFPAGFNSTTAPLTIGWLNLNPSYHFVGTMDEVVIYDRALSDAEIAQHYVAGLSNLGYCDPLAPTIDPIPNQTANELVPFTYTATATGNPAPAFSLSVAPAGMTINASTGVISWTPAVGQAGVQSVTVTATNSAGSASQSFVITVTNFPAYSLNVTAVNGTVAKNPDQTMYVENTVVELTATPAVGYEFTGWGGDASGTANPLSVTMDGNKNITANFAPINYWSMITPTTGGTIPSGAQYLVQWTAPPEAVNFKVLYSVNNGTTWTLIGKDIPTRTLSWSVPASVKNKKKCLIKVVGFTGTGVKVGKFISGLFTIEGSVKVITPNGGGDPLTSESFYPIDWQTSASISGSVAKVVLHYTLNGGTTWKKIAALPENSGDPVNPGSYSWTVPVVSKDKANCLVKVTLKDAAGTTIGQDMSDLPFTIQPQYQ